MNSAAKLIIGIIILMIGLYWYAAPLFGHVSLENLLTVNTFHAFVTVFSGLFGLLLIFLGAIIAWIEYEDMKWERKEKTEKMEEKPVETSSKKKR